MLSWGVLLMDDIVYVLVGLWVVTCGLWVAYRLGMRHLDLKADQIRVMRQKMQAVRAGNKPAVSAAAPPVVSEMPPWIPELLDRLGLDGEGDDIPEGIERYLPLLERFLSQPPPPPPPPADSKPPEGPTEWDRL